MAKFTRLLLQVRDLLPEFLSSRLRSPRFQYSPDEVPSPPTPPPTAIRLLIAPANYAGQGYLWARAAETLRDVGATNMQITTSSGFGFASDYDVPANVVAASSRWQKKQFATVISGYSHVLVESGLSIFGNLFSRNVEREIVALREHGVSVAMLSHGSDLRLPSRHRDLDRWSPFRDDAWDRIPVMEARALAQRELLDALDVPVFVATPDLLLDWPDATWLPVVVDPRNWTLESRPFMRPKPLVVHVPTNRVLKGSDLIEPELERLHDDGVITYRRVEGVPSAEMPALYKSADIVLDQFRIGSYGVAAIEAMAAGRLVLGHVHEQVREVVRRTYGIDVPIVQATPDSLADVLLKIVRDFEEFACVAASGPLFVSQVHDGRASAEVLRPFLGATAQPRR